jgi:hypothetical protein
LLCQTPQFVFDRLFYFSQTLGLVLAENTASVYYGEWAQTAHSADGQTIVTHDGYLGMLGNVSQVFAAQQIVIADFD